MIYRSFKTSLVATLLISGAGSLLAADQGSPAEAKLRESLRNTMLQLRTAETERAALQAEKVQTEEDVKALNAKVEGMTKQMAADKEAADKSLGETKSALTAANAEGTRLKEELDKWKAAYKEVAALAQKKESERAALYSEGILLKRKISDRETKNLELFKVGSEILKRYAGFGLGTALTAREPFTGITKVKLQSLVQDYQDKLEDQRVKPEAAVIKSAKGTDQAPQRKDG